MGPNSRFASRSRLRTMLEAMLHVGEEQRAWSWMNASTSHGDQPSRIAVVASAHYSQVFFGFFLIFIGLVSVTKKFQDQLRFREAFLVGFFLSGLIVFGSFQRWWLEPLLTTLMVPSSFKE